MIKHFIDLDSFTKKELRQILAFAQTIKKNPIKYSSLLKSKSLGLLFEKQSTRTRLSFAIGMQKIGGHVIELNKKDYTNPAMEAEFGVILSRDIKPEISSSEAFAEKSSKFTYSPFGTTRACIFFCGFTS